jgi:hypothetical protein
MSFEPRDYLRHIQVEIEYLTTVSEGVALGRFLDDATLQRAFVRSLEVIGEAAKRVPESFRSEHPQVAWRAMAGCGTDLSTVTLAWTTPWSGMSSRPGFRNCAIRSHRYSRPNMALHQTAAGAMMGRRW